MRRNRGVPGGSAPRGFFPLAAGRGTRRAKRGGQARQNHPHTLYYSAPGWMIIPEPREADRPRKTSGRQGRA